MKIRGFLNRSYEPPAPFIKVLLTSKSLGIHNFLDLHIDTGASATIILDKDMRYLRLSVASLRKAARNIGGIGGLIDTYLIDDAVMMFKTEEGMLHEERLSLLVGVHRLERLAEEERRVIMRLPSLLGRDILRKFKFSYDERFDEILMES